MEPLRQPEVIHYALETLGAFIGPLLGVPIADFCLVRKQQAVMVDLVTRSPEGRYHDETGANPAAVIATAVVAVIPVLAPDKTDVASTAGSSASAPRWPCTCCARGVRR